jgi:uncharacterized protein
MSATTPATSSPAASPTTPDAPPPAAGATPPTRHVGPTGMRGRSAAPDLARGAMLLLIVLANAPWYLWGSPAGVAAGMHPVEGSVLDRIVQVSQIVAVDGRTYPMFAFLFGYGIWQMYRRQHEGGTPHAEARRLLRRRHWWMVAFGAVHALLLWMGDVIGAYGLAGLVLCWLFLDRSDKVLRVTAWILVGVLAVGGLTAILGGIVVTAIGFDTSVVTGGEESLDPRFANSIENPLLAAAARLGTWLLIAPSQGLIGLAVPAAILFAWLAARQRVLEEPEQHLPLLRRVALIGIASGWVSGAFVVAQHLGVLMPEAPWAFTALNTVAGLACGVGYVALFGLIAARMRARGREGRLAWALMAVGKRSLTCYLLQSVVFSPLMAAWGFGFGETLSSWQIASVAVATWLATVVVACVLEAQGKRGPAEWLLRRLTYGGPAAA